MKRIALALLLAAVCIPAFGQRVTGTFSPLKKQTRVKMVVDYSEADIMGMPEEQWYTFEEDWAHDKVEVVSLFFNYANRELEKEKLFVVGSYNFDMEYTLYLIVRSVDIRGNHDCDLVLVYNDEFEIGRATGIRAEGGTFGSKLNLMKDGAEHTGKAVGKFLVKELSKEENVFN